MPFLTCPVSPAVRRVLGTSPVRECNWASPCVFPDKERGLSTVQTNYTADGFHVRQLFKFLWFRMTVHGPHLKPGETARVGSCISET